MPQTKVAVVIPTHKAELNPLEKISLAQCRKVLGRYQIIFVLPDDKNFSFLEQDDMVAYLSPQYFQSVKTYNQLMMLPSFYELFSDYDYILIHELDSFVFYDALEIFCALGYDYIGAPWPYYSRRNFPDVKNVRVGNSGFCLRNVKAHYNLLTENADLVKSMMGTPNDDFYAYCGVREDINFNVPPIDIATSFSVEYLLPHSLKSIGNKLPFGVHGWTKMSADFYVELFAQFGYDLQSFKSQMNTLDHELLQNSLKIWAANRLVRRIQRGQSITQYLPTKYFDSVRIIRSSQVMKVLGRLLDEAEHLTDKIFIYNKEDWPTLVSDLSRENLPHLILTLYDDDDLTEYLKERGFVYGEHFISFRREYLNRCEELFHNLGK